MPGPAKAVGNNHRFKISWHQQAAIVFIARR
jgi:hypothetical protein